MKFRMILSTLLAAVMLGASITPALADDDKGKGKKKGHYKNGKAYGMHPSQNKRKGGDWDDDDRRYDDRRYETYRRDDSRYRTTNDSRYGSQYDLDRLSDRRQQTKNEWRNIAYVSGGVALLGLLNKDSRLVFAGAAGTLYSLYRYEQDRKSQSSIDRLRASYFSRPYFVRDGRTYDRRIVSRDGQRYYQFVRR
jgi:hypothetical protein